jgi:hypothetical protein
MASQLCSSRACLPAHSGSTSSTCQSRQRSGYRLRTHACCAQSTRPVRNCTQDCTEEQVYSDNKKNRRKKRTISGCLDSGSAVDTSWSMSARRCLLSSCSTFAHPHPGAPRGSPKLEQRVAVRAPPMSSHWPRQATHAGSSQHTTRHDERQLSVIA